MPYFHGVERHGTHRVFQVDVSGVPLEEVPRRIALLREALRRLWGLTPQDELKPVTVFHLP